MVQISDKYRLYYLIAAAGFTSFTTQILLLREFISAFSGNELVLGVLLANWMLLTGIGAFAGKFYSGNLTEEKLLVMQLLLACLPFLTLLTLSYTRYLVFPEGVMLDLEQVFYYSFLLILPFCLLSGVMFTFFAAITSKLTKQNHIRNVYGIEASGNIAGGLVFNLLLVSLVNPSGFLLMIILLNSLLVMAISVMNRNKSIFLQAFILMIAAIIFLIWTPVEALRLKKIFPGQELIKIIESPYGRVVTTVSQEQINFYENGTLLYSSQDLVENEEGVHYLMSQVEHADTILIISGGLKGISREVSKYDIKYMDYAEINPAIIQAEVYNFPDLLPAGIKLNIVTRDPLIFLKKVNYKYDAVLVNLPDPSTAQINRFYTLDFLKEIQKHMKAGSAISLSLSSYGNYLGEEALLLFSSIYKTMDSAFPYVTILPGSQIYFIGSRRPTGFDFQSVLKQQGIETSYVGYYVDTSLMKIRSEELLSSVEREVPVNTDFHPIAYFYHIKYWLSHSSLKIIHLISISILIFILAIFLLKPMNFALFSGGLSAASIEFIILISFQIIFGYVYYYLGLIITAFMIGLIAGSMIMVKHIGSASTKKFSNLQVVIFIYAISIPLMMFILKETNLASWLIQSLIFLLTVFTGTVTGLQYAIASKLQLKDIKEHAAKTYGADMIGSAVGALITAVFLVPVLGLLNTGFAIGALNLVALLNLRFSKFYK